MPRRSGRKPARPRWDGRGIDDGAGRNDSNFKFRTDPMGGEGVVIIGSQAQPDNFYPFTGMFVLILFVLGSNFGCDARFTSSRCNLRPKLYEAES